MSDFRNAPKWDPRTYSAAMVTDEPIRLGSRFELQGGLLEIAEPVFQVMFEKHRQGRDGADSCGGGSSDSTIFRLMIE